MSPILQSYILDSKLFHIPQVIPWLWSQQGLARFFNPKIPKALPYAMSLPGCGVLFFNPISWILVALPYPRSVPSCGFGSDEPYSAIQSLGLSQLFNILGHSLVVESAVMSPILQSNLGFSQLFHILGHSLVVESAVMSPVLQSRPGEILEIESSTGIHKYLFLKRPMIQWGVATLRANQQE